MSAEIASLVAILGTVMTAATPLLFAALGEVVTEKSGVLNLGVEGMMLAGAVVGFVVAASTGSATLGVIAAAGAGVAISLVFGALTLGLRANQVATGLALTLFGVGLSALMGRSFVGFALAPLPRLDLPGLSDLPVVGPLLFAHDALTYLALAMVGAVHYFLFHTRAGLVLRAVGESHDAAHAVGYPVIRIRLLAVMFGGAMAGLGGVYLSLVYTPMWVENMTAGRGWIALALVMFATWRPLNVLVGAYLFGGVTIIQLYAQGLGITVPSQFMSMLPYLATILVLVLISRDKIRIRLNAPACIGKTFNPAA